MRSRLRRILSGLAVALGCLAGILAWAELAMAPISLSDRSPAWYLAWFGIAGTALFGLSFLIGSLAGAQDRKSAGIIFLTVMPVAAFCLAYPSTGILVWRDGGGWFQTPIPAVAIPLAALFYALFLGPFWLSQKKERRTRRAVASFTLAALGAGLIFAYSRWTVTLLPRLAGWSAPFLLLGLFWLRTAHLGWPPLLRPQPSPLARRLLSYAALGVGILCAAIALTLTLSALGSNLFSADCSAKPPFVQPLSPNHAVFTARVIFTGRSLEAMTRSRGLFRADGPRGIHDRQAGDWAIGVVESRFWGMPHWTSLVLLTNNIYWEGETYFVDGRRRQGLLTQVLPIVDGGVGCSRTRTVQNAIADLRLLRRPPPHTGTRIIGCVRAPEAFTPFTARPSKPAFLSGAQVHVTGPAWNGTISTDSEGMYELDGLAPGDYTLQITAPDTQVVGPFQDASRATIRLRSGALVEHNFELFWNGRIEGQVKDDAGKPAHAWLQLISADRSKIPGYANSFQMTAGDGSYQFWKIPPGKYLVMLNPQGPSEGWPYDLQYYPSGVRREKAQVFQLAAGQRMVGVDFKVLPLPERTTQVRVTWQNGTPAAGAHLNVAYENTGDYNSVIRGTWIGDANQNGLKVVHTYGHSQVRIVAEQILDHTDWRGQDAIYSRPAQFAADRTPDTITLVLSSQD